MHALGPLQSCSRLQRLHEVGHVMGTVGRRCCGWEIGIPVVGIDFIDQYREWLGYIFFYLQTLKDMCIINEIYISYIIYSEYAIHKIILNLPQTNNPGFCWSHFLCLPAVCCFEFWSFNDIVIWWGISSKHIRPYESKHCTRFRANIMAISLPIVKKFLAFIDSTKMRELNDDYNYGHPHFFTITPSKTQMLHVLNIYLHSA